MITQDTLQAATMTAEKLEVAGVIIDSKGRTWAPPADNVEDLYDLYAHNPLSVPVPEDGFHYQTFRLDQVDAAKARGFVVVMQDEVGIPASDLDDGKPVERAHRVGDAVLMKIPQVYRDAIEKRKNQRAREVVEACEPTQEMIERAKERGFPIKVQRTSSIGGFTQTGEKE